MTTRWPPRGSYWGNRSEVAVEVVVLAASVGAVARAADDALDLQRILGFAAGVWPPANAEPHACTEDLGRIVGSNAAGNNDSRSLYANKSARSALALSED